MLYFQRDTRIPLLRGIYQLLASDGVVFLGSSEQPADPSLWTVHLTGGTCHYQPA